jgi:phage FluMu protein Com
VSDIRCQDAAGGCGKLLARCDGATITIVCPRCGRPKAVSILALVAELQAYLCEVEAAAEASGKGFML